MRCGCRWRTRRSAAPCMPTRPRRERQTGCRSLRGQFCVCGSVARVVYREDVPRSRYAFSSWSPRSRSRLRRASSCGYASATGSTVPRGCWTCQSPAAAAVAKKRPGLQQLARTRASSKSCAAGIEITAVAGETSLTPAAGSTVRRITVPVAGQVDSTCAWVPRIVGNIKGVGRAPCVEAVTVDNEGVRRRVERETPADNATLVVVFDVLARRGIGQVGGIDPGGLGEFGDRNRTAVREQPHRGAHQITAGLLVGAQQRVGGHVELLLCSASRTSCGVGRSSRQASPVRTPDPGRITSTPSTSTVGDG